MIRFRLLAAALLAASAAPAFSQSDPGPGKSGNKSSGDSPKVCFYAEANYKGQSICVAVNGAKYSLASLDNKISSIKLKAGLRAKVCTDPAYGGTCTNITASQPDLSTMDLSDVISSLTVY